MVNRDWLPPTVVFRMRTINNLLPQHCWSARDVTAGMLVVKNKIFSLLWELNSNSILLTPSMGASESLFYHFFGYRNHIFIPIKEGQEFDFSLFGSCQSIEYIPIRECSWNLDWHPYIAWAPKRGLSLPQRIVQCCQLSRINPGDSRF